MCSLWGGISSLNNVNFNFKVERVIHKEYFNCYKIYWRNNKGSRPFTGLSFLLYIDDPRDKAAGKDLVLQKIGKGALLTLGERNTFLDPDSHGVEIIPNMVNVVRFGQTERIRLPEPHGKCKDRNFIRESLKYNFSLPYVYTGRACYSACMEYHMIKNCKCQDVGQYGTLQAIFKNVSMCGTTDEGKDVLIERMKCVQNLRNDYKLPCLEKCPPPCQERKSTHQVSYLELLPQEIKKILSVDRSSVPDEITHNTTVMNEITQDASLANNNKKNNNIQKNSNNDNNNNPFADNIDLSNIAWVDLKRESISYYLVEDTPKMTFSDYLAKIGGTCNLWSGITVFVLVELLDLVCRLCKRILTTEMSRKEPDNNANYNKRYSKDNGTTGNVQMGFIH